MTEGWVETTFEKVCTIQSGAGFPKKYQGLKGEEFPFYKVSDMNLDGNETHMNFANNYISESIRKKLGAKLFPKGSVIFPKVGGAILTNKKRKVEVSGLVDNNVMGLIPTKGFIDPDYLFWLMWNIDLYELSNKANPPSITQSTVKSWPISVPPLEEQKRIVAILDEAFEGIERAQANAQQNLANARELFESYMNAIFTQANSKYTTARIADICTIRPPKKEASQKLKPNDKVSFVAMENLGILAKDLTLNTERSLKDVQGSYTYFAENDVLLAKITPCFENGKLGIARNLTNGIGFGSSEYIVIRSGDNIKPDFMFYFLSQKKFREDGAKLMTGACGHKRVPKEYVEDCLLPVPPIAQQDEIIEKLDGISAESNRLQAIYEQKLKDLAELKQSLLQKAFSGELTSSNVVAFTRPVSEQQTIATTAPEFAANVLAYAHNWHASQQRDRTFGRVKAQKILHMAESVAGVDMGRQPIKDAAGPNDFQHMLRAEDWAKNNLFFEFTPRLTGNGYDFKKLGDYNKLIGGALEAVKPYKDKLEKILALMMPMNTREAEVLATVHAAWNNLLLDNAEITDDAIIHEARENWTESKRSIPEHEFRAAITTIRNNGIVPDGTAKRVIGQESLPL